MILKHRADRLWHHRIWIIFQLAELIHYRWVLVIDEPIILITAAQRSQRINDHILGHEQETSRVHALQIFRMNALCNVMLTSVSIRLPMEYNVTHMIWAIHRIT